MPASPSSTWTGPTSIQLDDGPTGIAVTRELRTRSATPSAPRIEALFAREARQPEQVLVVWDPGQHWPQFSLTRLALPATQHLQRVLLRQENAREVMAEFHLTPAPLGDSGGWACVEVITQPGDPLGLRIGLSLMEQAQRSVLLAGGTGDKDLVRRINEFVRSDQWAGPPLIVVAPADKPSRADRLRKAGWPRGLRVHVLELFPSPTPDWSAELLRLVCGEAASNEGRRAWESEALPRPMTPGSPSEPQPGPGSGPGSGPGGLNATTPPLASRRQSAHLSAVELAFETPGALACALWNSHVPEVLKSQGDPHLVNELTRQAAALWAARCDGGPSLDALCWTTARCHHFCVPMLRDPACLLMLAIDREFGDLSQARWQLAVARQHAG